MTTLTVGSGQQFRTIAAAVSASASGDILNVSTGTYLNDFVSIRHSLTLQGVGGPVSLLATYEPPNGKAIITEGASGISVTLAGLTIAGATVPDGNGAGIRYEGGSLLLDGVTLTGNQDGILGASDPAGSITIRNSVVTANGAGDGRTHGIYIGAIDRFDIANSTVSNTSVGHNIKSRAANNTITNNLITDVDGTASYLIDLPNGGNAQITGKHDRERPQRPEPDRHLIRRGGQHLRCQQLRHFQQPAGQRPDRSFHLRRAEHHRQRGYRYGQHLLWLERAQLRRCLFVRQHHRDLTTGAA